MCYRFYDCLYPLQNNKGGKVMTYRHFTMQKKMSSEGLLLLERPVLAFKAAHLPRKQVSSKLKVQSSEPKALALRMWLMPASGSLVHAILAHAGQVSVPARPTLGSSTQAASGHVRFTSFAIVVAEELYSPGHFWVKTFGSLCLVFLIPFPTHLLCLLCLGPYSQKFLRTNFSHLRSYSSL